VKTLAEIIIDGNLVWQGTANPSSVIDLNPDFTLSAATDYPNSGFIFSKNVTTNVDVQYVMTDGSTKDATVYPQSSDFFTFTVKATGKTTSSNLSRTIQAEYNASTSKITDYHEIAVP